METEKSNNKNILIILGIVILILAGLYIKFKKNPMVESDNLEDGASATTTTQVATTTTGKLADITVERVPITETKVKISVPSLDRPIVFATTTKYTQEVKDFYISKINGLKSQIKANPNTLLPWIDLGSYYKAVGDFAGALEAWTYVSKAAPTDYISRGNIGNLYAYYLKDNGMAEMYYKDAISKGPKQTYLYIQLAEVYRDVFNNLDKARGILDQGLKIMPGDPAFTEFKNSLK